MVEDVLMQNNWIRNSGGGINILGQDDTNESAKMKRVQITNKLFTGIDSAKWGADGRFLLTADGEDITFENNTVFNNGNPITAHRAPSQHFIFRNNIISYSNYSFVSDDAGSSQGVFAKYFADGIFTGNVIVNANKAEKQYMYIPPQNALIDNYNAVGFVDLPNENYRITVKSHYQNKGADFNSIKAETDKAR